MILAGKKFSEAGEDAMARRTVVHGSERLRKLFSSGFESLRLARTSISDQTKSSIRLI